MFKQTAVKQCFVLLLALASAACSSTDSRTKNSNRSALPSSPMPQARFQAPRNVFVPPVFDEYRPQQPSSRSALRGYEEYAPERNYNESYTSSITRQPPAVVEVLRRPQLEARAVEPLATIVQRDNLSKNELEIDPYASVPDREVLAANRQGPAAPPPPRSTKPMSRAAKALSLQASAESAVGRNDAAINKVERALRIEPQSPALWYQLANLNFKKGRYDQAIGFARKALPMASGNRNLVEQNLNLMSKAAVKTGNTRVFKEVLDYKKQNY